ncbi:MAG: methyltransferase [Clostridiales bacterium]|nr:methyltransferase [Clostridiales bacterium]
MDDDLKINIEGDTVVPEELGRGGLKLLQHKDCYKLDTASVLLAWFAASFSRAGKSCEMLELGSGTGGVSLLASARCGNAHIDGVELVELAYKVFCENIRLNKLEDRICAYNCDLRELPPEIRNKAYDVVFMNPPFYDGTKGSVTDTGIKSEHESKARFSEQGGLEDFIRAQSLRTRTSGGFAVMCICPDRVPEVFGLYEKYKLTPVRLLTVHANASKPAFLALIAGKKGSPSAEFKVLPPLFINEEGSSALTKRVIHIYEEEHDDCFI